MSEENKNQPATSNVLLAVRLRGTATDNPDVRKTMESLKLRHTYNARLLENTPSNLGMLRTAKNLVAWGEPLPELVEVLIGKRGERLPASPIDDAFLRRLGYETMEFLAKSVVAGDVKLRDLTRAGLKPVFRLHPPRGGFKRSLRRAASDGGELGYRGDDINRLVKKMI
jgi:large subunit ribosomal protein L30